MRSYFVKICVLVMMLMPLIASPVFAEGSYRGYIYDSRGVAVPSINGYRYDTSIDGSYIPEIGPFKTIEHLFVDKNDMIYIADSGNNRIVRMDPRQTNIDVIGTEPGPGKLMTPKGVYVSNQGLIYVADTGNKRIVVFTQEGEYVREYGKPDSPLIGETFNYSPEKLVIDRRNYMMVISEGSFDGIMQIDMNGVFRGFFGANHVPFSFTDALTRIIATKEQRAQFANVKPPEFSNMVQDDLGFIYTTTKGVSVSQVKRLSPVGTNTLFSGRFGDLLMPTRAWGRMPEAFVDLTVDDKGIITALDQTTGRAFQYDKLGNLIFIFGGLGDQDGLFLTPSSIAQTSDGTMYIADKTRERIDVFRTTPFGDTVHKASAAYVGGDYQEAIAPWEEVLKLNSNYDMAYRAIGKAKMRTDDFGEAMQYFKNANSKSDYSEAYFYFRKQYIRDHFVYFFTGTILLLVGLVYWRERASKRKRIRALTKYTNPDAVRAEPSYIRGLLREAGRVLRHPVEFYVDIQESKSVRVSYAFVIVAAAIVIRIFSLSVLPFLFSVGHRNGVSFLMESLVIFVPWLTWCVVNWSLSTILEGEGKFGQILYGSAFALMPFVLLSLPISLFSYALSYHELSIYSSLWSFTYAWIGLLIILKVKIIHDFNVRKVVWISLLTIFGMLVLWLICFLLYGLINQLIEFLIGIYKEISFRGGL